MTRFLKTAMAVLSSAVLFASAVFADNCFITAWPTSDPAPSVFTYNGETRLYFYCTQDKKGTSGTYPIDTIHVYSTADMFHWRDDGVALDEAHVSWARSGGHQLWAPHVVYLRGRYRMYVPETNTSSVFYNFAATNSAPTGMFTAGAAITGFGSNVIDPFCFVDTTDSVRVYMIYRDGGGAENSIIRMNDSGTATVGSSWRLTGWGTGYKEGAWVYKRNGYYYFIYAFQPNNSGNEYIDYATAPVPASGGITSSTVWTVRGHIVTLNANEFTNHSGAAIFATDSGGALTQPFCWWHGNDHGGELFPSGVGRCSAIEYMTYTTATPNLINAMSKTYRGVGICHAATDSIQVDRYSSRTGTIATTPIQYGAASTEKLGWYLSGIANGATVTYNDVDFTPPAGAYIANVCARVGATVATNTIRVTVGSTVVGTINVPSTGGLTTWSTTTPITLASTPASTIQNLTLTFTMGTASTMNVNWLQFGLMPISGVQNGRSLADKQGYVYQRTNKNTFVINRAGDAASVEIRLFNIKGQEMVNMINYEETPDAITVYLDAKAFASGTYLLKVKGNKGELRIPFIY